MILVEYLLLPLVLFGHGVCFATLVNQTQACGWPRRLVGLISTVLSLSAIALLIAVVSVWIANPRRPLTSNSVVLVHGVFCSLLTLGWLFRRWQLRSTAGTDVLIANHTRVVDMAGHRGAHSGATRLLAAIPGNEFFSVHVQKKELLLPRWPSALDGFKIAHLSDMHMSGRVGIGFYEQIVEATNELQPDLVFITGDFFDHTACLDWTERTFARLQSPLGTFFVLGNHDKRVGADRVRQQLVQAGLNDLGGLQTRLEVRGEALHLAGTERPWLRHCGELGSQTPPGEQPPRPFRILLSHSPDQFPWARTQQVDLMLAGHTHGGQIRLPGIGAPLVHSRLPVEFTGGICVRPPTTLHVSRGLCGLTPIRWNCPPELALLCLRSAD